MRYSASLKAKEQGAIVRIPKHIYCPTIPGYQWSMSHYHEDDSKAYMELDTFKGDLALLRLFYSIWWTEHQYSKKITDQIKIYMPAFELVFDNHRAPTPTQVNNIVNYLKQFEDITGVITWLKPFSLEGDPDTIADSYDWSTDRYKIIESVSYEPDTRILTVESKYFAALTSEIYRVSKRRDKKDNVVKDRFGKDLFIKSHHTIINSNIIMERSPIAVETVFILIRLIALSSNPRITVSTLLDRNPLLSEHYTVNHYNSTVLRKSIQKAFDIMTCKRGNFNVMRTELHELYPNLMLPKMDDLTANRVYIYTLEFPKNCKK